MELREAKFRLQSNTLKQWILENPAVVYERLSGGCGTLLHLAAAFGQPLILDTLIEAGAPLEARDADGCSPVHIAAERNNVSALELLVRRGANVNATDNYGNTPLHRAYMTLLEPTPDPVSTTRVLLEAGADPNIRNEIGATPIVHHLSYGDRERYLPVLEELLCRGADPGIAQMEGKTALDILAGSRSRKRFDKLIEALEKAGGPASKANMPPPPPSGLRP